jgi:hypothetical protein
MGTRSGVLALVAVGVATAIAVVVAVLVLRDSGPTSREDYQAVVVNARDRVDFAYGRIAQSGSIEELIERIDEAGVVVGDAASDMDDEGAPDGLEDEHERLVDALNAFADVLASTAAQFRDPTFAGTLPGITSLSFPEWDAVNAVLADLDEQGIEVEQLARH